MVKFKVNTFIISNIIIAIIIIYIIIIYIDVVIVFFFFSKLLTVLFQSTGVIFSKLFTDLFLVV